MIRAFFMTTIIDLTTNNSIYNPLGPQGQWIMHRFGRRNYPELELGLDNVLDCLNSTETKDVFLSSVFGDSLCYSKIKEIISLNKHFIIHTYLNLDNTSLIEQLANSGHTVAVRISGINELADKIYHNSNWEVIKKNLQILKNKAILEFEVYHHNQHQIPELIDFCIDNNIKLKLSHGTILGNNHSNVVSEEGEWLYDVTSGNVVNDHYMDADELRQFRSTIEPMRVNLLSKTSIGYLTIRTYVRQVSGRNILEKPQMLKIETTPSVRPLQGFCVAVTGHVFPNETILKTFSNMLCNDWKIESSDIFNRVDRRFFNQYYLEIAKIVNQINNLDLNKISISKNKLEDILSYLSDSNI